MFGHDGMESDDDGLGMRGKLLQELIEKIMEMKGPEEQKSPMPAQDPKVAMLEIDKGAPGESGDSKPDLSALLGGDSASEPDSDDMKKPLGPDDIMAMKRKHMGL